MFLLTMAKKENSEKINIKNMTHFYKQLFKAAGILLLLLAISPVRAQQLPDPGFEDWSGGDFGGVTQNKYWHFANIEQVGLTFPVGKQVSGRTGSALYVQNTEAGTAGIYETSPGYATLGNPWIYFAGITNLNASTAGTDGGIAFTYRPDSLVCWIKRTGPNMSEKYNILFYSWIGTSTGTSYKSKGGACSETTHYDEESDIVKNDANECNTTVSVVQVAEGWRKEAKEYTDWTRISIPIKYLVQDKKPEKCNVILSPGTYPNKRIPTGINKDNSITVDDIQLIYNSTIDELRINDLKERGFNAKTTSYTKANVDKSYVPAAEDFVFLRSGRKLESSEYTLNLNGAGVDNGKPVIVTVTAEDKSSSTTYEIYFVSTQSTNFRPESIKYTLNGTEYDLPNWNANNYDYDVELPYGTTATPVLVVNKAESSQDVQITQPTSPTGTGKVKMTAQSGASQTYTINFSIAQLSDNTLQDILINGESLAGFSPTKNTYTVELPLGTTTAPTITWKSLYAAGAQTIKLTGNTLSGQSGQATITVSVPGNKITRTYTLNYVVRASSYAFLADIKVGGTTIPDFVSENRTYSYDLPMGTKTMPAITYTKGHAGQTVETDDSGIVNLSGDYKIKVTAEDGTTVVYYYITFTLLKSSNTNINSISVNGTPIAGFSNDKTEYDVEIDANRTEASVVTAEIGEDGQTINITKLNEPEGVVTVRVTAPDGKTRKTFTINVYQNKSSDNTLSDIKVNGTTIVGFSPDKTDYQYTYEGSKPTVTYTLNDATATATQTERSGSVIITVTAQNGDKKKYTIVLKEQVVEKSDYAYLEAIYINGVAVPDFVSTTLSYNFTLTPWAKPSPSAITYDAKDGVTVATPTVSWNNNTKIFKATLKVTAEDGVTKNTYTIIFVEGSSSDLSNDATLKTITINGAALSNFNANTTSYTYTLPAGTTQVPTVAATTNHSAAKAAVTQATSVSGKATIVVTAEDGTTKKTYTIQFQLEADNRSNDATLSDLTLDGNTIDNFKAATYEYSYTIPYGGAIPQVGAKTNHSAATVQITQAQNANGKAIVVVTAEDEKTKLTYTIQFSETTDPRSTDCSLKSLSIDLEGTLSPAFRPNITEYTYNMPTETTGIPVVSYELNSDKATATVTQPQATTDDAVIVVQAEHPDYSRTYTIHFALAKNNDATLSDLKVNGQTIDKFDPTVNNYRYTVEFGGEIPEVTYTLSDPLATAVITNATSLPGTTIIVVTAQDETQNTYQIRFAQGGDNRSTDATLSTISVDLAGQWNTTFNSARSNYIYLLEEGTTDIPQISVQTTDANASAVVTQATSTTGTARIVVTAQNPDYTKTYTVRFEIEKHSDVTLQDLQADGETVDGFDPQITSYIVEIPFGSTAVPAITATANDPNATVQIISATTVKGQTLVYVTDSNNKSNVYRISFAEADDTRDKTTTLAGINIDGEALLEFEPTQHYYTIELPNNASVVPVVTADKAHETQTIAIVNQSTKLPTKAIITVTAENGNKGQYVVNFSLAKSQLAQLNMIYLDGVELEGFVPSTFNYNHDLGSSQQPVITVSKQHSGQIVEITSPQHQDKTSITVISEDRSQTSTYTISYSGGNIGTDNQPLLTSLQVDEQTVTLVPDQFQYIVSMPSKIGSWNGIINYTTNEATKEGGVELQYTSFVQNGECLIILTGQDGQKTTYKLIATPEYSHDATLENIYFNGSAFAGFNANTTNYDLTDMEMPEVTYSARTGEKQTIIYSEQTASKVVLEVVAEDGITTNQYTFNFKPAAIGLGTDAGIMAIQILDQVINVDEPLDYAVLNGEGNHFEVTLPAGLDTIPDVVVELSDKSSRYFVNKDLYNKQAEIQVFPQDASWYDTYVIDFTFSKSSNAQLKGLFYGSEEVDLSLGNTQTFNVGKTYPVVTFERGEAHQGVTILGNQTKQTIVSVRAQDGTINEYVLNFNLTLSNNTDLASITIGTQTIVPDADVIPFVINPGEELPAVSCVKGEEAQRVLITNNGRNGVIITVVAADGETWKNYTVEYQFKKNDVASLKDLLVFNGSDFESIFASGKTDYDYELSGTAKQVPTVLPIPTDSNALVKVEYGLIGQATNITITSEDGKQTESFTINFSKAKSNNATLANVMIEGDGVAFSYDPNEATYHDIEVPISMTARPTITWEKGEPEQTIEFIDASLSEESKIIVTAPDGKTKKTYSFTFKPTTSGSIENILKNIAVNEVKAIKGADDYTWSVDLPYGTTDFDITYSQSYPSQSVIVSNMGANNVSKLLVLSNIEGVENVTYNLKINVSNVPFASAKALYAIEDGNRVPLADFDPLKYDYIYVNNSEDQPEFDFDIDDENPDLLVGDPVQNVKTWSITIKDTRLNEENTYRIHTYYKYDDDKLNMDFENWEGAQFNSAQKPTGWYCPADAIEKWPIVAATYHSGEEVSQAPEAKNGSQAVQLKTVYSIPNACSMPGIMSLTSQSYEMGTYWLFTYGSSYSSFSAPVQYRNTPDEVSLWYKEISHNRVPGWSFYLRQISESKQNIVIDDVTRGKFISEWTEYRKGINTPNDFIPSLLDIKIAASDTTPHTMEVGTEGASSKNRYTSTMYVDDMHFYYNPSISNAVVVNGIVTPITDSEIKISIDNAHLTTAPKISFVNAQPYYQHDIIWDDDTYTTGKVISHAENYSTTQEYTLKVTYSRPISSQLKDILVDEKSVGTSNLISVPTAYGTTALPQIEVIADNSKQHIEITYSHNSSLAGAEKMQNNIVTIQVWIDEIEYTAKPTSPNATYTLSFVETQSTNNTLAAIYANGTLIEDPFDASKTSFSTNCEYAEAFPTITYDKQSDGQQVTVKIDSLNDLAQKITLVVLPEDKSAAKKTYTINQTKNKPATTGAFESVTVNNKEMTPLSADMTYAATKLLNTYFVRQFSTDTVVQTSSKDYIDFVSKGTTDQSHYRVTFTMIDNPDDATLAHLQAGSTELLDGINTDFNTTSDQLYAEQNMEGQVITPSYSDGKFSIAVEAISKANQTYTISVAAEPSSIALLESLTAEDYTITPAFDPNIETYTLKANSPWKMPSLNPRRISGKTIGAQPSIEANPQGEVGGMAIEYSDNIIDIFVYAQTCDDRESCAEQKTYTLTLEKAEQTPSIDGVTVFGVPVAGFRSDKYNYDPIKVPDYGNVDEDLYIDPVVGVISNTSAEQQVSIVTPSYPDDGDIEITVTLGDKSVLYNIPFEYTASVISHNANLADLYINGLRVTELQPNTPINAQAEANGAIEIYPAKAEAAQTVEVTRTETDATITVTAQDGTTTQQYLLNIIKNSGSSPRTDILIYLNGEHKNIPQNGAVNYTVEDNAVVEWLVSVAGQQVVMEEETTEDGKTVTLKVTAPNGTDNSTYTLNISYNSSQIITDLQTIRINGIEFDRTENLLPYAVTPKKFVPNVLEYRVDLPRESLDTLPSIEAVKAANNQEIKWDTLFMWDSTTDTVAIISITAVAPNAEQKTYRLNIMRPVNYDATPADILIDNLPMSQFTGGQVVYDSLTTRYTITLAEGQTYIPAVSALLKTGQDTLPATLSSNQTINPFTYTTELHVVAQAGNQKTYWVTLQVPQDDDATLSDLQINGRTIQTQTDIFTSSADFDPATTYYNVTWPASTNTSIAPVVTCTPSSDKAYTIIEQSQGFKDMAKVTVVPAFGKPTVYEIHFTLIEEIVIDECLDEVLDIRVGDNLWSELDSVSAPFNPAVFNYTAYLPKETPASVDVAAVVDEENGCLIAEASSEGNDWTLEVSGIVLDQNDEPMEVKHMTYTVHLEWLKSDVSTLAEMYLDDRDFGVTDSVHFYDTLPVGTRQFPDTTTIGYTLSDDESSTAKWWVDIVDNYNANYELHVHAENGDSTVYYIDFIVEKSDTNTLEMIYFDGITLDEYEPAQGEYFDSTVTMYSIILPRETETMPEITYDVASEYAEVEITDNTVNLEGEYIIEVTAENGYSRRYVIIIIIERDNTAFLDDLQVSATISGETTSATIAPLFDKNQNEYVAYLPYGVTDISQVSVEAIINADNYATAQVVRGQTLADQTTIIVTSEDKSTTNTYYVTFVVEKSTVAYPEMIYIEGVAMDRKTIFIDFDRIFYADTAFTPTHHEYFITLPLGETELPEVTAKLGDAQQTITIKNVDSIMAVEVTVTAGNTEYVETYILYFEIIKSGVNTLDDLKIDGKTVDGFRSDSTYYTVSFPAGTDLDNTLSADQITWVLTDTNSTAALTQQDSATWRVTVTAENGDKNTYLINIIILLSDNAYLDSLIVNGVMINDFNPYTLDYEYFLYKEQTTFELAAVAQDDSATVTIDMHDVGDYSYIHVQAEDGSVRTYTVLFTVLDYDRAANAESSEVCFRHIEGNIYRATSMKKNVQLCIYDINGRLLQFRSISAMDNANEDVCETEDGLEIELDPDVPYIYTFMNNTKRLITRGKVMHTR